MMGFGSQMTPLMVPGQQSLYSSVWQRQHSIDMLSLGMNAVSSMYPFQNMGGLNPNSMTTQILASIMGNPDGLAAKFGGPILGGNPIASQMSSYANLQGIAAAGLGTGRGISMGQLTGANQGGFYPSFYQSEERTPQKSFKQTIEDLNGVSEPLKNLKKNLIEAQQNGASLDKLKGMVNRTDFGNDQKTKQMFADAVYEGVTKADKSKNITDVASGLMGNRIIKGVNLTNTLGFSLNTLQTARDEIIRYRLFSPTQQVKGLTELSKLAAGGDTNHDIPMLVASAKSLWGNNISDKELWAHINDSIGSSPINLSKIGDREGLDRTFRELKSTARESNIDINTLLSFQSQTQAMTSQNPALSMLGGIGIMKMITSKAQQLATLATDNSESNNWLIRTQGGTAGALGKNIEGTITNASMPIPAMVAALRTYIAQTSSGAQQTQRLGAFDTWASGNNPHFDASMPGIYGFMQSMQKNFAGFNASAAYQYAYNNPVATSVGLNDNPELLEFGNRAVLSGVRYRLSTLYHGKGINGLQRFNHYLANNDMRGLELDPYFNQDPGTRNMISEGVRSGAFNSEVIRLNPTLKATDQVNQDARKIGQSIEASMDRNMGMMRQDTVTRFAQKIASGQFGKNGFAESALEILGVSKNSNGYKDLIQDTKNIGYIASARNMDSLGTALGAGFNKDAVTQLAAFSSRYGIKAEDLTKIAKNYNDKDFDITSFFSAAGKEAYGKDGINSAQIIMPAKTVVAMPQFQDAEGNFNYRGDFGFDSVKAAMQTKAQQAVVVNAWKNLGVDKNFDNIANQRLSAMSKDKRSPGAAALADAVGALGQGDADSQGRTGTRKGLGIIDQILNSSSLILGGTDGAPKLAEPFQQLLNTMGARSFSKDVQDDLKNPNEKTIADAQARMQSMVKDNATITGLATSMDSVEANKKALLETQASGGDLSTMVQRILDKLGNFDKMAASLSTIAQEVKN
jgi:hypothetical protein